MYSRFGSDVLSTTADRNDIPKKARKETDILKINSSFECFVLPDWSYPPWLLEPQKVMPARDFQVIYLDDSEAVEVPQFRDLAVLLVSHFWLIKVAPRPATFGKPLFCFFIFSLQAFLPDFYSYSTAFFSPSLPICSHVLWLLCNHLRGCEGLLENDWRYRTNVKTSVVCAFQQADRRGPTQALSLGAFHLPFVHAAVNDHTLSLQTIQPKMFTCNVNRRNTFVLLSVLNLKQKPTLEILD